MSIVRQTYDRKPTDQLKDLDVNSNLRYIYVCHGLQAAVHLGRDYILNLRSVKNRSSKLVQHFFRTTEKLIQEQTEITGLSTINWNQLTWRESSLLRDRAVRFLKSKISVFGAMFWRHQSRISSSLRKQDKMVFGNTPSQRNESN